MRPCVMTLSLAGLLAASGGTAAAEVNVNIGVPAPPAIVLQAPPRLVVVPTTPAVRYAPDLPYNFFRYGGRYYTVRDDAWFVAPSYGGPWSYVELAHVPRPLRVVPVRYYRSKPGWARKGHPHGMPPGQAKKLYGNGKHGKHRHEH